MITCGKCHKPLTGELFNTSREGFCPQCGVLTRALVFPAYFQPTEGVDLEKTFLFEEEASCFYHPTKKAKAPCDVCGRFICALCEVEMNGRSICPVCIETGRRKGRIASLENQRIIYDRLALALVLGPLILFWPFIVLWPITAIAAIFVSIRYWRRPQSLVPRSKVRFIVAMLLALLQLGAWGLGLFAMIYW